MKNPWKVIAGIVLACLMSSHALAQQSVPGSVRGAVATAAGRPVGSVWVLLLRDSKEAGRAVTADDGRYYIGRLGPGAYTVQVKRGDAVLYRAQVTLPRDAVHNVRLP